MDSNEIDKLFKKGLEDPDVVFEETHWDALNKRLDQRAARSRRRFMAFLSLSSAAALLFIFFMIRQLHLANNKIVRDLSNDHVVQHDHTGEVAREGIIDTVVSKKEGTRKPMKNIEVFAKLQETKEVNVGLRHRVMDSLSIGASGYDRITYSGKQPLDDDTVIDGDFGGARTVERVSVGEVNRGGTLSVLLAPDLTSVRGSGRASFSQNLGLMYTYPISKRLSVSTGILYARKNYVSAYSFYKPTYQPETNHYPDEVKAFCDVLDVPVTVGVELLGSQKNKLTVNLGASSYFMLRENYTFSYEGYGEDRVYEIKEKNNHIMGIADFSVSFEHKVSERISIGVRPFYKLPLTGIGYGQTKLDSKGIAVTLGVDFPKK